MVFIEYNNKKANYNDIIEDCKFSCKRLGGNVKSMSVYIKPEDGKAYFVSEDISGSVEIIFRDK